MKILSAGEFREFDGVISNGLKPTIRLTFKDGTQIECTSDHEIWRDTGEWIESSSLSIGDSCSGKILVKVEDSGIKEVFDAINVKDTASFTANGIEVHNCALLYIDECAFVANWDDFSASVLPTLSSGKNTKMIFTSTPHGLNHFYHYCANAQLEGKGWNGFKYLEVPWYKVPGRDEAWKQEVLETLNYDMERFAVEYECAFEGSSGTLISGSALGALRAAIPIHMKDGLRQYESPEKGRTYVLVADVSRGKGLDYSAFHVFDVTDPTFKQVCTYRNNLVTPTDYAAVVYRIAKLYNEAYVLVEVNDIGGQVPDTLYDTYEYDNILSTQSKGRSGKRISGGFGGNTDRGIRTTKTVKAIGCSVLKLLIEQGRLKVNDKDTISELSVFSSKGNSYEAELGHHDDLVMGMVLFAWLTTDPFFKDICNIDMMKLLRDRTDDEISADLVPFGFMQDGIDDDIISDGGQVWQGGIAF